MKQTIYVMLCSSLLILAVACSSKKDSNATLNDQKVKLEKLKSESASKAAEIKKLQDSISAIDTANAAKLKLVGVSTIATENFNH